MPEEKRQITVIKRNKNINNLNDLFNMMSEQQLKKDKKEIKSAKIAKEKNTLNDNKDKLNYYFSLNDKEIKNKKEKMNPIFFNDKKMNNAYIMEQDLYKSLKKDNLNINGPNKIEIDTTNSLFNYEGFFYNNKNDSMDASKINFKEEISGEEDIKENEDIKNYFNKSLIDKIENPFFLDDKNETLESIYNRDKSKFFNFDFFNDDNNDGKF